MVCFVDDVGYVKTVGCEVGASGMVGARYFAVEPDVAVESVVPEACPPVASGYVGAESGAGVHACLRTGYAVHAAFMFDADGAVVGCVVGIAPAAIIFADVLVDGTIRADAVVC